jgi:hypothetical protein
MNTYQITIISQIPRDKSNFLTFTIKAEEWLINEQAHTLCNFSEGFREVVAVFPLASVYVIKLS